MVALDEWPYLGVGGERVPLTYEYFTPTGLYQQGYLEGKKGRHITSQEEENIPSEFIMGIKDGYGDWLTEVEEKMFEKLKEKEEERLETVGVTCKGGHDYESTWIGSNHARIDQCKRCGHVF